MIDMKCSGELKPWIVKHALSGIPRATSDFAKETDSRKKFDQVYWTIRLSV